MHEVEQGLFLDILLLGGPTTNIIEGFHRQLRKATKTKTMFPSDQALEKMLYLASQNAIKKWTQRYRNWDLIINQLTIFFPERISPYL